MVFCPIARGTCPGRSKCIFWARGRTVATDTKLLAAKLTRYILNHTPANPSQKAELRSEPEPPTTQPIPRDLAAAFWEQEGLPNISSLRLIDRDLDAKVAEVEKLAAQWLANPSLHATLQIEMPLEEGEARTGEERQGCFKEG